jgi:hypothetical protein
MLQDWRKEKPSPLMMSIESCNKNHLSCSLPVLLTNKVHVSGHFQTGAGEIKNHKINPLSSPDPNFDNCFFRTNLYGGGKNITILYLILTMLYAFQTYIELTGAASRKFWFSGNPGSRSQKAAFF